MNVFMQSLRRQHQEWHKFLENEIGCPSIPKEETEGLHWSHFDVSWHQVKSSVLTFVTRPDTILHLVTTDVWLLGLDNFKIARKDIRGNRNVALMENVANIMDRKELKWKCNLKATKNKIINNKNLTNFSSPVMRREKVKQIKTTVKVDGKCNSWNQPEKIDGLTKRLSVKCVMDVPKGMRYLYLGKEMIANTKKQRTWQIDRLEILSGYMHGLWKKQVNKNNSVQTKSQQQFFFNKLLYSTHYNPKLIYQNAGK